MRRDHVMYKSLCHVQKSILCVRDYITYKRSYYRYIIFIYIYIYIYLFWSI